MVDKFLKNWRKKIVCVLFCLIGEVVSVPLPRTIKSIWPLPFGLLLQHAAEVNSTAPAPSSSSNPLFGLRDLSRPRRESGHSPQHNFNSVTALDHIAKGEAISMPSHVILKDPLEEPHVCYWTFYLASLFSVFPFSFLLMYVFFNPQNISVGL